MVKFDDSQLDVVFHALADGTRGVPFWQGNFILNRFYHKNQVQASAGKMIYY